jgi:Mitochondrial ribosomal protein subunit
MASAAIRTLSKGPAVGVLPPASPFAELLRRSRFASYDPEIKQTYSAPPAYAQRGNWGLKRPISQRNKDAHITLKSYEDHAQYIEWNNAGAEVRFVKQFEELNIAPTNTTDSIQKPFFDNLGPIQNSIWMTDSEFDVAEDGEYKYSAAAEEAGEVLEHQTAFDDLDFSTLGKAGKGAYGATMTQKPKAPLVKGVSKPWNYRQPNIEAMNEVEFNQYLKKLRQLRPQFLEEIRAVHTERMQRDELKSTLLDGDVSDLQLASINCLNDDHRAFLNKFFECEYEARDVEPSAEDPVTQEALPKDFVKPTIKPQPHRFGGLIYSHPSILDTLFTTEARPAHFLSYARNKSDNYHPHEKAEDGHTHSKNQFPQVSYAGMAAKVEGKVSNYARPLFSVNSGPKEDKLHDSLLRDLLPKTISILEAPRVVGKNPTGLHGTSIKEIVVENQPAAAKGWDNAHQPGTFAYNGAFSGHMAPMSLGHAKKMASRGAFRNRQSSASSMDKLKGLVETLP